MRGETDLATLLQTMQPRLESEPFVFCSIDSATWKQLAVAPIGFFREAEGITLILDKSQADDLALPYKDLWAMIVLTVHSDLTAVGFLAAITAKLAAAGISVNPISAFHHDYLFVPWAERGRSMVVLQEFSA